MVKRAVDPSGQQSGGCLKARAALSPTYARWVDVDLSKLPTGTTGWHALVSYAVLLGDLSELDYLELKGTLQFAAPRERKRSAIIVARAVLGMANRMPDAAQKHLSGSGVILVGVEQGAVQGVEQVDGAVLRDAIQPYLGSDGPQWDHQFVVHPEGLVLAVIVDPPKWGDSIHTCRKDFSDNTVKLVVRDGEVFVRIPGKTRAANSHEISQLERRRLRAPHTDAQVQVGYTGSFDRISKPNLYELMSEKVDDLAERLLNDLPGPAPVTMYGAGLGSLLGSSEACADSRGVEGFKEEVEEWRQECRAEFPSVTDEFLRYTLVRGEFVLVNESNRYLEMVRASVQFPPNVSVLLASDTSYCDHGGEYFQAFQLFPKQPVRYGKYHRYDFTALNFDSALGTSSQAVSKTSFAVERNPAGCLVTWLVGDLPPRARVPSGDGFSIFVDEGGHDHSAALSSVGNHCMDQSITARWEVTARGVDHVFSNSLVVECRQDPGRILMWSQRVSAG